MAEPDNGEARREMMMAALEGGMVLQKGLGAIHAATHPLGALGHHHGELNGILLAPVIRMNRQYAGAKYAALESAIGLPPGETLDMWCSGLLDAFDMPKTLREIGIDDVLLPRIAEESAREHLNLTNPKPLDAGEFRRIFDDANRA